MGIGSQPPDRLYQAAKYIAQRLYWKSDVCSDPMAYDHQDYVVELYLRGLEAGMKFDSTDKDPKLRENYVLRSMYNARCDIARTRWMKHERGPVVREVGDSDATYVIDDQLDARESLEQFQKHLNDDEWQKVQRMALGSADYDPTIDNVSYQAYAVSLWRLRKKVLALLENKN